MEKARDEPPLQPGYRATRRLRVAASRKAVTRAAPCSPWVGFGWVGFPARAKRAGARRRAQAEGRSPMYSGSPWVFPWVSPVRARMATDMHRSPVASSGCLCVRLSKVIVISAVVCFPGYRAGGRLTAAGCERSEPELVDRRRPKAGVRCTRVPLGSGDEDTRSAESADGPPAAPVARA